MTKKIHPVETELMEALSLTRKPKEADQRFLSRIIHTANKLPEENWEEMSSEAQNYCKAGIISLNEKKPLPTIAEFFAGTADETVEEPETEEEEEEEAESADTSSPTHPKKKDKPMKKKSKKNPAAEPKAPGRKPATGNRGKSATQAARMAIISGLNLGREKLEALLDKKGIEVSNATLTTILFHTRATVAALAAAGLLDKDYVKEQGLAS